MCVFGGKTMQNKYENLTPEAIGEIGDTEAINQLQTLIECGTIAESVNVNEKVSHSLMNF